jgi:hypothetical protein
MTDEQCPRCVILQAERDALRNIRVLAIAWREARLEAITAPSFWQKLSDAEAALAASVADNIAAIPSARLTYP